ncbi:probable cytokinesis protein Don1 [Ustilago bromivora]|uniref:Probable cytokinesis protein Don1 n=1 Tax=Ustilago bromivora TaxID=307758 RepID=A0A1K0FWK6_9BASI|nr:probable cytokinesis protein Don1 [Ustilago bromivora]SYW75281.1 probable cytokinesis protein Don1 [Ustilago bromivora]
MESMHRQDSSISFPTLPSSPIKPTSTAPLPTFSTSECFDSHQNDSMPPPSRVIGKASSTNIQPSQQQQRHSIISDDSSAASSADYFGAHAPISRPISATTLASSRPSSVASNASTGSHVQGQLTACADLLSPGLASALGLVPSNPNNITFPSSSRSSSGQHAPGSADAGSSLGNPARRRVRAQSAHSGALANRRPSMPIVPSMNHRISVASVSSFESLPEDEMVQGFLAPATLMPKSRASSYERITRSATGAYSHAKEDTVMAGSSARSQTPERSVSNSSIGSSSNARSSNEGPTAYNDQTPSDSVSLLSSSASSSAHGGGPSTTSSNSTITTGSTCPSFFLRRAATAPVPPVDSSVLMAHRQRSARELLDTERSFVASLTLIDQEYYQPLMASLGKGKGPAAANASTPPILSRKSMSDIFSNFYDILQLSKELLSQLEDRLQVTSYSASSVSSSSDRTQSAGTDMKWNASVDCVGDILATLAPFLKMYSLFVKNFSSALQRIEYEQKTNEAFSKFLKETDQRRAAKEKVTTTTGGVRQAFGYGLGFQAHLLTIVQRIPRYKLLVDDLVKSTPETHPDFVDLRRASHMMEQVASYINENVRQHEMVLTMLGLQKSLQGLTEPLVAPGRALIKRGTLMKTCRRNIQPREFFLFTDCLMYASPISGGMESASAAWIALAQRGGLYAGNTAEQLQSPTMTSPSTTSSSPIESILPSASYTAPLGPRARFASVPEPYTPLAGAIFSLAGHQLQFRDKFGLRDCTVVGVEDNMHEGLRHCFEIRTPEKSFAVYAESQASKEAWVNCIREARADHMSARRTLKAEEDSIEAKRERRRSLYKIDATKAANRCLSTQSLGAYLAGTNLIGSDKAVVLPSSSSQQAAEEQGGESSASRSASRERGAAVPHRRSRVDSLPNLLLRPPSFPSFPTAGTNLSLANLLPSSGSAAAAAPPLRVLEDYNAPVWVPDNRADKCCNCQETFGMWRRKHHCRLCGQVVCRTCSQRSFLIPSYQEGEPDRPARACDRCYDSVFPPDTAEEGEAAAVGGEDANAVGPDNAEMSLVPSTSTDDSVAQTLGAYRFASDLDTDVEAGSHQGSPVTPPVGGSAGAGVEVMIASVSLSEGVAGKSAMAKKKGGGGGNVRSKSLRFETLPPPEMSISEAVPLRDGAISPTAPASSADLTPPPSQSAPPTPHHLDRRRSETATSTRTSPTRPLSHQQQPPILPAPSKSLAGPLASGSPRVISNRASALEAHRLFTQHHPHRNSAIQAATSGSGTFRLVTPRLTTPESELPPGAMGAMSGKRSIMDAGYFGGAAIAEEGQGGVEEGVSGEGFKPWMLHAMSPNGGGVGARPVRKRPLSAAARLSRVYGPMLAASGSQSQLDAGTSGSGAAGNKV